MSNKQQRVLRCSTCDKRARTYYDKEMFAVDGEGYVTDCGTGGCGFTVGKTREVSRSRYIQKQRFSNDTG